MNEKELSQYYWLEKEIKSLEEKIEELGYGIGAVEIKDTIVTSSHPKSSIQEKRILLINQLTIAKEKAQKKYLEIEKYIETLEDTEIRIIMRFRFLDLMSWYEIGDILHYDRSTVSKKLKKYINSHISP